MTRCIYDMFFDWVYILLSRETSAKESDEAVWMEARFSEGSRGVCIGITGEVSVEISVTL